MARTPRHRLRLLALRMFAHRTRFRHSPTTSSPIRRILVVRPDHLGDLIFSTPALRALRHRYPDAHITALIGPWGTAVLSNNPRVDEIITLPFPGFTRQSKPPLWQPYGLLRRWARQLRGRYDLAFILRFDHWWGALLAYLAEVPQRVGHAMPEVTPFLSHAVPYVAGRHEVEQNLGLVGWGLVDWELANWGLEFHVPEQAAAWARDLSQTHPLIAIHPGAGAAIKLWRAERWAAVADALTNETGSQIILTGSVAERPLCQEIAARMDTSVWIMAGKTTLDQLAAMFAQCRLVLGLDSGPLHLAVAVDTPTVHLYGPVDPVIFGHWGTPERHRVLVSAWPCIPCNRLDYGPDVLADHVCVQEIGVDEALTAARQVLRRTQAQGEIRSRKV